MRLAIRLAALLALAWILTVAGGCNPPQPTPPAAPSTPTASTDASPAADASEPPLLRRLAIDYRRISTRDALSDLAKRVPGLAIRIDPALAADYGGFLDRPVTFSARRIPVCEVLDLLTGLDLGWEVLPDGAVHIQIWTQLPLHTVRYPVAGLLASELRGRAAERQELSSLIGSLVNATSDVGIARWGEASNEARLDFDHATLLATQTYAGHTAIARLLARLYRERGLEPEPPAADPPPALAQATTEVERMLAAPIDVDFTGVDLAAALDYVRENRPGLDLLIDPALSLAEFDPDTRLHMRLRGLPLAQVLGLCLGNRLTCGARPGYVLITSRRRPSDLIRSAYPVADLCRQLAPPRPFGWPAERLDRGGSELINLVISCESPDPNATRGDDGATLSTFQGSLIVMQTRRGQEEVARLLEQLRTALAVARQLPDRPWAAVPPVAYAEPESLAAVRAALATPADADFSDTPLHVAVRTLADAQPPLAFVLSDKVDALRPVTLKCRGLPRGEIFRQLLGADGAAVPEHDYVFISPHGDRCGQMPLVMYPIPDLKPRPDKNGSPWNRNARHRRGPTLQDLFDDIEERVNAKDDPRVAAWNDEYGPACLREAGGILLVRQTPEGQRAVNARIQRWRFREAAGTSPPSP